MVTPRSLVIPAARGVSPRSTQASHVFPDGAAALLTDGTANEQPYLSTFPYLAHPHEGYEHSHD